MLDVIAEHGVAGVTYRAVADAADVPLGSMTYHFPSQDELVHAAFVHLVDDRAGWYADRMAEPAPDDPREQLARLVVERARHRQRDLVIEMELWALAVREARYRDLVQDWMHRTRDVLARDFPADLAPILDALQDGLILHGNIGAEPADLDRVRLAVSRLVGPLDPPGSADDTR